MYQFRPVTERIAHMRRLIRERVIQADAELAVITTEAYKRYSHAVPVIRRPLVIREICEKMTVRVEDFEIIVGNRAKNFCGSAISPEWMGCGWIPGAVERGEWTLWEDGFYHNRKTDDIRMTILPEDLKLLQDILPYWEEHAVNRAGDDWAPDGYDELCKLGSTKHSLFAKLYSSSPGHLTPGFQKIINVGYGAIKKEAEDWLEAHFGNLMGEDVNKYLFYKSAVLSCEAAITLVKRYAGKCLEKAETETSPARKAELLKMADGLKWISEKPARTFWEACQAAILYQLLMFISGVPGTSLGRFDQYTWPFLKKELEAGTITLDEAQEIVDAFFLKANTYYGGSDQYLIDMIGSNTYQHTTIGGVDPKTGMDATNPVSFMVLETIARLRLHDPTISLRINKNSPDEIWDCALETCRQVGGLPLFQNDEVIIPAAMRELGFSLEDARDYAIIGCQEITGSGNDYPAANGNSPPFASLQYGVVTDMAINNGINPINGVQCRIKTGYLYEMNSIDEVHEAVRKIVDYLITLQVSIDNYTDYLHFYNFPHAMLSISMAGCMESGRDAVMGGCRYNSYGGTATGLATVADCMTTIKYMCFDKKLCTTRELYDAVMANWAGYETLRQKILKQVPHYGNGDPYADMEMNWITTVYYEACKKCSSVRSKVYKAGLYGASDHVTQGYVTWATPDGRRTGEPIADSTSPAQGRDISGPTAVFNSTVSFDHSRFMDGISLNLKIHPNALNGKEGTDKLRDMTKTYFESGGLEVQYNVVSADTLRNAQKEPETYKDLIVRIAGYSAYFVELSRDCQNDLISRHDHML
jgi:formate C-acetyltransferase